MTVFKGFLTIMRRNLHIVFLYVGIFLTISIIVQKSVGEDDSLANFKQTNLDIAVIDRDGGELAKGLTAYLDQYHTLKDVPDDPSIIQDRLFYREVYYVVTIPDNFEKRCLNGNEPLPVTKVPGSTSGYYVEQQIHTFLNDVRIMTASGFTLGEAIDSVQKNSKSTANVTLLDKSGYGGRQSYPAFMYQYMPYIILSILCYALSYIMIAFHNPDIKKRMACSAIPTRSQNMQLVLGFAMIGIFLWIICTLMVLGVFGSDFLQDPNMAYYLLNSFMITLVSLSLAFLIGILVHREDLINAVVNVVSLGMSFLCGVFVDLEIMSKGIKSVSRFLPVYWYEIVNDLLGNHSSFSASQRATLYTGYGLQLMFAAAFLGVALMIGRNRRQAI